MSNAKVQMKFKFQNQLIIPPRPPLAKGGWGDLGFGFDLTFACLPQGGIFTFGI
jgi:hypothetical protein